MMQAEAQRTYTATEYLDFEINSDTRHEYINGDIIPMTGGTPEHNEIASILNAILRVSLKGKPYSIFIADQRLWIPAQNIYTYPDVMVVARPLELQAGRKDTIMNPILIAEVLSKSTRSYDKDEKFTAYRTIPSFQEYLLIDQYKPQVDQYSKTQSNKWSFSTYNVLNTSIALESIDCEISVSDLYSDFF